jgi:RNA polymerase sigma-70 factor (ECF subfamily)
MVTSPISMNSKNIDAEVIERAVAGSTDDTETLLGQLEHELRSSLTIPARWQRSLDRDDILQVSFLEAFLRIGSLRDRTPSGLRAWMRRLVQNNLTDAVRALDRDKRPDPRRRLTHGEQGQSARTLLGMVAGDLETAGAKASVNEQVESLQEAVLQLPASYRLVIQRVDLDECTVAEIALEMQRSTGAVHLLRSRAHIRLAELMGER